jgi:hypothetical protein
MAAVLFYTVVYFVIAAPLAIGLGHLMHHRLSPPDNRNVWKIGTAERLRVSNGKVRSVRAVRAARASHAQIHSRSSRTLSARNPSPAGTRATGGATAPHHHHLMSSHSAATTTATHRTMREVASWARAASRRGASGEHGTRRTKNLRLCGRGARASRGAAAVTGADPTSSYANVSLLKPLGFKGSSSCPYTEPCFRACYH